MIRHAAAGLAALTALTATTLAIPAAASASTGKLIINGQFYFNPSGCITSVVPGTISVANQTDQLVYIYIGPNCTGNKSSTIDPGYEDSAPGVSVGVS